MRYTQSLFHGILPDNLSGNIPFFKPLCTLEIFNIFDFFVGGLYYSLPVKMFENNLQYYIQYSMKEIRIVPFYNIYLDFLWN